MSAVAWRNSQHNAQQQGEAFSDYTKQSPIQILAQDDRRFLKKTGIPPIVPALDPTTKDWLVIDARKGQSLKREIITPHKTKSLKQSSRFLAFLHTYFQQFINHWVFQEFSFVMNKLSIFGLIMGLMFLGAIFFCVGFLTAYQTLPTQPLSPQQNPWEQNIQSKQFINQRDFYPQHNLASSSMILGGASLGMMAHTISPQRNIPFQGELPQHTPHVQSSNVPSHFQPFTRPLQSYAARGAQPMQRLPQNPLPLSRPMMQNIQQLSVPQRQVYEPHHPPMGQIYGNEGYVNTPPRNQRQYISQDEMRPAYR